MATKQEELKTIFESLQSIQEKLKAPKGLRNSFGNYNYRSTESILEAVKPILAEEKCVIILSDKIINIGDRYYIEATATLKNFKGDSEYVTALAKEEESKKGMDGAQVTGSTSSYARKYALNGLLLIDDTKDADTDEFANQNKKEDTNKKTLTPPSVPQVTNWLNKGTDEFAKVEAALKSGNFTIEDVKKKYTLSNAVETELKGLVK